MRLQGVGNAKCPIGFKIKPEVVCHGTHNSVVKVESQRLDPAHKYLVTFLGFFDFFWEFFYYFSKICLINNLSKIIYGQKV